MTSLLELHGYSKDDGLIQLRPRSGEDTLRTEDILEVIEREGESIAVVMLAGVQYYTGQPVCQPVYYWII